MISCGRHDVTTNHGLLIQGDALNVLALADDATGALEIDTETRQQSDERARAVVRSIAMRAKESGVAHIYKKTDSTLRGPIAAEFRGLLDVWPELPLVYAPAYPALGRTVRSGVLYVDGRPVSETA